MKNGYFSPRWKGRGACLLCFSSTVLEVLATAAELGGERECVFIYSVYSSFIYNCLRIGNNCPSAEWINIYSVHRNNSDVDTCSNMDESQNRNQSIKWMHAISFNFYKSEKIQIPPGFSGAERGLKELSKVMQLGCSLRYWWQWYVHYQNIPNWSQH